MNYWLSGQGPEQASPFARWVADLEAKHAQGIGLRHFRSDRYRSFNLRHLGYYLKGHLYKSGLSDHIAAGEVNKRRRVPWFGSFSVRLCEEPWLLAYAAQGILHVGATVFSHNHTSETSKLNENDINGGFCPRLACAIQEVKYNSCDLPQEAGRHFFYASLGRNEPIQGADFGVVAHLTDEDGDLYRPVLFQGKIASRGKRGRWIANLHRLDANGVEQIDKLAPTGIGWYIFYHQDRELPLPGPTVRPAQELKNCVALSWTVATCERATDFATFLVFDLLDPEAREHPGYRTPQEAIDRLALDNIRTKHVLAVSAQGGVAFEALQEDLMRLGWREDAIEDVKVVDHDTGSTPGM